MPQEDIKILLVDDEKQFVDTLSERLEMRGFNARVGGLVSVQDGVNQSGVFF